MQPVAPFFDDVILHTHTSPTAPVIARSEYLDPSGVRLPPVPSDQEYECGVDLLHAIPPPHLHILLSYQRHLRYHFKIGKILYGDSLIWVGQRHKQYDLQEFLCHAPAQQHRKRQQGRDSQV